jgi:hypothetical protein
MSDDNPLAREINVRELRNPYVVLALRRAAGTHRKPEKSQRVAGRIDLVKQIRRWLGRGD